ncbi:MAG: hypothetical protein HQM10_03935 [Candidatus Riflebacteria bacterium]|nr:hypothetical protein [Candidatus Riflebacteria bacterium]
MKIISSAAVAEKNKIATDSAWLILLEINIGADIIRLAGNNEDVTWNSHVWQAFPFELDTIGETGKGEIPSVVVKVSNITGEIQQYLEAADGANGSAVIIRVINTTASSSTESELELSFVLDRSEYDENWISFYLTGANCLSRRVPPRRYLKNFCAFNYGGIKCGVSSGTKITYPACNKTKSDCETRGNSARFGGYPWMPEL